MVAIIIMTGTKNDNNGDLICLQSRLERGLNILAISNSKRTKYACNVENLPRAIENNILMIASILNEIASIYGPFRI